MIEPVYRDDDQTFEDEDSTKIRQCESEYQDLISPESIERMRWSLRFDEARIPHRFANACIEDLTGELGDRSQDFVERYQSIDGLEARNGIFLSGSTGSGKTHALVAIMKELIKQGSRGRYCDVAGLFQELKAGFNQRDYESPINDLKMVDILLLDDLCIGPSLSAWEHDMIYGLINRRYNDGTATLITSNVRFSDLSARIGDRPASRINQMCEIWIMGAGARDRRNPRGQKMAS